jgi:hypothetical protein
MQDQQDPQPARTGAQDQQVAAAITQHTAMLRTVLERLDELVQLLTPKPSDGPTLDELLAGLVTLVSDQAVLLRRIDARTAVLLEPHLVANTLPAPGDAGANGNSARG